MITINLDGHDDSDTLKAKKVWQHLFEFYQNNEGDLKDMDNMLSDYSGLVRLFGEGKEFVFYFYFVGSSTYLVNYMDYSYGANLRIEWDSKNLITITKMVP